MRKLPKQKTRIVCTIGPASDSVETLQELLKAGMNVARLNFSHGDFTYHATLIERIHLASGRVGIPVAVMADLPGPKMRIGELEDEPVELRKGQRFVLTARKVKGNEEVVSVTMAGLPKVVRRGDTLYLNDGLIQLVVEEVRGQDIHCTVVMGGELRSRKGLNLPGVDLGTKAFTERDRECLAFALEHGVDAVSQSFVGDASDVEDVRRAASVMGFQPFIIAKIERASLVDKMDEIIEAADGIMVARGDLGVEMPIERIALAQKSITRKAHRRGKPVITATQMLESMVRNPRPTRAEATDVANAILDGTDAVMLSEESATGEYPVEATRMLARIARAVEPHLERERFKVGSEEGGPGSRMVNLIAESLDRIVGDLDVAAVVCPTESGATARNITRFRLPCWILALSGSRKTCQGLLFSYGVWPILFEELPSRRVDTARRLVREFGLEGEALLLTQGPSRDRPTAEHGLEIIGLGS